jgi:hypothetical protein
MVMTVVEYTDVEIKHNNLFEIGEWLDIKMPNPPLPDPQRWTVGCDDTGQRVGIRFANEKDATLFILRWS